ncbi:MAG: DUF4389 domain-containing protein [Chloroflexota bacterium]
MPRVNEVYGTAVATLPVRSVQTYGGSTLLYPVDVAIDRVPTANRFWAIPVLGYAVKSIILIPHMLALIILAFVVALVQYIVWIPVLLTGRYPEWAFSLTAGTLRWSVRVSAYVFGLTDRYPPFGLGGEAEPNGPYPVRLAIERQMTYNRGWAIPVLGGLVKYMIVIPHMIILYFLVLVVILVQLALWVSVLFTGRYPNWGHELVGGYIRWSVRLSAFLFGLTDRYPPFEMA